VPLRNYSLTPSLELKKVKKTIKNAQKFGYMLCSTLIEKASRADLDPSRPDLATVHEWHCVA